jgi:hypothetical protein
MTRIVVDKGMSSYSFEADGFHVDSKEMLEIVRDSLVIACFRFWDCVYEDKDLIIEEEDV